MIHERPRFRSALLDCLLSLNALASNSSPSNPERRQAFITRLRAEIHQILVDDLSN